MYVNIEGARGPINGESIDSAFKEHLQALSLEVGVTGPELDADKGGEGGQCVFHDAKITAVASCASPALLAATFSGEILKTLVVVIRKAGSGQQPYIQWKFHNVQVASFSQSFSSEARPVDTMTFKYAKAEMIYFKQNQDGSVESAGRTAAWDADLNKSMAPTLPYKPTKK
jgi:type VI secretion system secreted protein Hcp